MSDARILDLRRLEEPVFDPSLRRVIWPIHCKGRIWSFAMVRVPDGHAFIPVETPLASVAGAIGGLLVAYAALAPFGFLKVGDEGSTLLAAVAFALASSLLGSWLARKQRMRRHRAILHDPERESRRRGAFVVPLGAALGFGRGPGKVDIRWEDRKGKPHRAVLTVPDLLHDSFRDIWKAPWTP